MRISIVVIAVAVSTGCASLKARPTQFTSFGEADPARDKSVITKFDALDERPADERPEVKVLVDTIPEGIEVADNTIKVSEGAPYELVGKFEIGTRGGFFPDYRDGWRKGLCYPQQPLMAITLMTWALVPTYWPCFAGGGMSREDAIDAAKTLAWSAGANLVLLSYRGTGEEVGGGAGFLIKTDLSSLDPKKVKPREKKPPVQEPVASRL